eukprot:IDg2114t1
MPSKTVTGRGRGWSAEELGHLAEAFIERSVDAVTGVDQTSLRFKTHLYGNFIAKNPSAYACRNVARAKGRCVVVS